MITKTCEICGCVFQVKPYREKSARFCSRACGGKWAMSVREMPNGHKFGNKWREGKPPANAFQEGDEPWNKNLKGIHLSPSTEFRPGRESEKRVPVGSVSIRIDKAGKPRAHIKVADPSVWRPRAVVVWEQENGPVPAGHVVHHADRNTLNDALSNLAVMTRSEHIAEHRDDA